jgi:hypothetical protein
MAEYGFVYCMSNVCMPGIYKIGFTRSSPHQRAEQLSSSTSVPSPFEVEWYVESDEADYLEKALHESFKGKRVSVNREFFKECPITIFNVMDRCYLSEWLSPDHLFRLERMKKTSEGLVS